MHYPGAVKTCTHKHLSQANAAACSFLSSCRQAQTKEATEVMKTLFYLIIRIGLHIL